MPTTPPNYRIGECCYSCCHGYPLGLNDPRWNCTKHRRVVARHDVCDDYGFRVMGGA